MEKVNGYHKGISLENILEFFMGIEKYNWFF